MLIAHCTAYICIMQTEVILFNGVLFDIIVDNKLGIGYKIINQINHDPGATYTRYNIQDTRFFISGKLPIVHDYIQCLIKC